MLDFLFFRFFPVFHLILKAAGLFSLAFSMQAVYNLSTCMGFDNPKKGWRVETRFQLACPNRKRFKGGLDHCAVGYLAM